MTCISALECSQEIKGVTLTPALRGVQITTLREKRAKLLEDEKAEADDFGAFLEDHPLDFTHADEGAPRWCSWLPLASPPTPPRRPKVKAFVNEQLSSEAVPPEKRRRPWNRHSPEEFRCREDSAGEPAVAEVACPDANYTKDASVHDGGPD